ncbi:type II CRISPR-associated endonuclease Cas1 [Maledivibacter halophilus]|uniref:CRISPR-associated endonuclease Cas1 n=1 Tax=Maledivibacter halophilus TaxID=36842 RepID=A0A1T5MQ98_9FIRM|nr:type II CRISPR-associated endonuclease Cas1 [Maledivibacter halophilus]SKC90410.1 CRISP-associated protein Cas1 [Maledivibacter halophilus]
MSIVLLTEASKVMIKNGRLEIKKDETSIYLNIEDIEALVIESLQVTLTPSAILYVSKNKVPLIFCNKKHHPQCFCLDLYNHFEVSKRIHEQVKWEGSKKILVWQKIIISKLKNQKELLKELGANACSIKKLKKYIKNVKMSNSIEGISSCEAIAARIYFKSLFFKEFRRKDENIVNEGLNYGYSLLRAYISIIITSKGLHPSLGICHNSRFNAFNLSDDIIEIFRPIVDYAVLIEYKNTKEFTNDFRKHLLKVMCQKVVFNNKVVSLKRGIELFIDSMLKYFNEDEKLKIPKLDVMLYEY